MLCFAEEEMCFFHKAMGFVTLKFVRKSVPSVKWEGMSGTDVEHQLSSTIISAEWETEPDTDLSRLNNRHCQGKKQEQSSV